MNFKTKHIASFIALTVLAQSLLVFGHGIRPKGTFPILVSVNTTRDIATQHSDIWDMQKKGSRRLEDDVVHLSIVINNDAELNQLDQLMHSGVLSYEKLKVHRDLQGINSDLNCYRTVEETFTSMDELATQYPGFVTVKTIGESWLKQQQQGGHDIKMMIVSAPSHIVEKGIVQKDNMMLVGGHHSRELPPPETLMRWAEHLLENYGKDADITWVLNRTKIHILPLANPDGREIVQDHPDWSYRKNVHPYGCSSGPSRDGVDLNRQYPMWWGNDSGSSNDPCSTSFRGEGPLSEPESASIYRYTSALFSPDIKRGTTAREAELKAGRACPVDASGIFMDVHSYGDFVYFPWGHDDVKSPNHHSLLTMAAKLAHSGDYDLWGPGQDGFLYYVSGDATDATYGIDCVASFGYELGSAWDAPCNELESSIVPIMKESLLYAAKSVSAPYKIPLGPDILNIQVDQTDPRNTILTVEASDEALIVSHAKFDNQKSHPIASVQVWVDVHPYDAASSGLTMAPQDGNFDSADEVAMFTLDTRSSNVLYFQATDSQGYAGPVSAVFVMASNQSDNGSGSGLGESGSGESGSGESISNLSSLLKTLLAMLEKWQSYSWR